MAKPLWDKGTEIDQRILHFTVGDDPVLDCTLAPYDCLASAAHARMLERIGILSKDECSALVAQLREIYAHISDGSFTISQEQEDCHTAIEGILTSALGDTGKKIHTGRSRNDQVIVALRLLCIDFVGQILTGLIETQRSLEHCFVKFSDVSIPGYTHLQPAMPSSMGMWIHSISEWILELHQSGVALLHTLDKNPLGAASGFDVPLDLDRTYTANLLGFSRVQRSVIDVQNSRGRTERQVLGWLVELAGCIETIAWDISLYTTTEFGMFSLPDSFTTGSSIMPQKKNPDVIELLRGRASALRGSYHEVDCVAGKLPSSYHRDLQLTKGPLLRGLRSALDMTALLPHLFSGLSVNTVRAKELMHPELYATYEIYRKVAAGEPFREAYQKTAAEIANNSVDMGLLHEQFEMIQNRTTLQFSEVVEELNASSSAANGISGRFKEATDSIFSG